MKLPELRVTALLSEFAVVKLLAELRIILNGMTLEQRRLLKIIVGMLNDHVDDATATTLVDLGLVVRTGDTYCATPAGAYVARIY